MAETLVPDTSVLVDGRITELVRSGEYPKARVLVPVAALAELEAQANRGLETGLAGLDELAALQRLAAEGAVTVEVVGERPSPQDIARADEGAIDAIIRDLAVREGAVFVTSDRVQAHAAAAHGVRHHYLRPVIPQERDLTGLKLWQFFDAETMSVHLKADCVPMVKRGRPGQVRYEAHGSQPITHQDLRAVSRECIEFTKRDYNSFIEMERHGCTVLQLGPMRITIAQPPFSDGLELTAVRPITKKRIDDYELAAHLLERIEGHARGVFVAGPPGSGKSTFAAAVAEHLHGLGRVVKTMEQPRDLQVPKEVTQYGALDRDMKWTGDVILLVRPDNVLYDEVRTTEDFRVFADMRLAGVGLIGVTHANRAIDAIQRLVGRVELGMIPQVVDTVMFVDAGRIAQVLELTYLVKVPEGMTQEDLARPVVVVTDVETGRPAFEMYTYGEQVVVMPLDGAAGPAGRRPSGAAALAERELRRSLQRHVHGDFEVEVRGDRATILADEAEVPAIIGKGGRTVQALERKLGIRLDIKALPERRGRGGGAGAGGGAASGWGATGGGSGAGRGGRAGSRGAWGDDDYAGEMRAAREAAAGVRVKRTGSNVFLILPDPEPGAMYRVEVEGAIVGEATASRDGRLRFKASSPEGMALAEAERRGLKVTVAEA